jgi:hypothetical protein
MAAAAISQAESARLRFSTPSLESERCVCGEGAQTRSGIQPTVGAMFWDYVTDDENGAFDTINLLFGSPMPGNRWWFVLKGKKCLLTDGEKWLKTFHPQSSEILRFSWIR